MSADLRDLLTLHLVPGLGPRLTAALLERFGSARAILSASAGDLQAVPHIGPKLAGEQFSMTCRLPLHILRSITLGRAIHKRSRQSSTNSQMT